MIPIASLSARRLLFVILCAYLALGVVYALATPVLEASDEYKHYPVVQYIQQQRRLPVLEPEAPGRWLQEGAQPPLYYLLMAAVTAPLDTTDLPALHTLNEHAFIGNPNQLRNKNLVLHDPALERFPWQGSVLAIYVIRFVSLLLGAGTIVLTAGLGMCLRDRQTGLLAAAFVAFNPMFLFVHTAVNNDSLAILLGSAGLVLLVQLWRSWEPSSRDYLSLGIIIGLGMLTKLSLGGLLLLAGLVSALRAWQQRSYRPLLQACLLILLPALFLLAPWLWRNWQLYGDLTGLDAFIAVQGTRAQALGWQGWLEEWGTFYRSFWGLFGGVNVAAPEPFYWLYNVAALLATAGLAAWWWRDRGKWPRGLWLLLAWPLILFALLIRWNLISPAFQGRLVFPAIAALAVLGALGFLWWQRLTRLPTLTPALAVLAFASAAALPWLAIRPAYVVPQPLSAVPEAARFGPMTFRGAGGIVQLVGVAMEPEQTVLPGGDPVTVTLYWRALTPVRENYLAAVTLLGRDLQPVSQVTRHPAGGMVPTTRWQSGEIWRDDFRLFVDEEARAPALLRVSVNLYDTERDADLPVEAPDETPVSLLLVGAARLAAQAPPEPPPTVDEVTFTEPITLWGHALSPQPARPGDTLELALYWRAVGAPAKNYTVFVHFLDEAGRQIVNADAPPLDGDYPTSWWQDGDIVRDGHLLSLPADLEPGDYTVAVGLYDVESGQRVQRRDGGDHLLIPVIVSSD